MYHCKTESICKIVSFYLGKLKVEVPGVEEQKECRGKGHESQELTQPEICENYSPFITVKLDHMMNIILCCLLNQLEKKSYCPNPLTKNKIGYIAFN